MAIALKYKSQPSPAHRCVIYIFLQNKLWNKISEILFLKPSDSKGKYCSQHWQQPALLWPKLWLAGWVQGFRRTSKTSDVPAVVQHLLSSSEWWASLWFDTSNKHNYFLVSVFHQWGFGSRPLAPECKGGGYSSDHRLLPSTQHCAAPTCRLVPRTHDSHRTDEDKLNVQTEAESGSVNSLNPVDTAHFPWHFCQSKISAGKLGRCMGSMPVLRSPNSDVPKPHLKTIKSWL